MEHRLQTPAEYNPAQDYARAMAWTKYAIAICAVITLALTLLIGR